MAAWLSWKIQITYLGRSKIVFCGLATVAFSMVIGNNMMKLFEWPCHNFLEFYSV